MYDVMTNFIKRGTLIEEDGKSKKRKEAQFLGRINVKDSSIQKSINNVNPGTRARYFIAELEGKNQNLDAVKFDIKTCLVEVTVYLQKHLPHDSAFLRDARVLKPKTLGTSSGQAAFGRLAFLVSNILKNTGLYSKQPENVADDIKRQYALYETVDIAYNPKISLEHYWTTVAAHVGSDGKPCFVELAALAKQCLIVSHGNAIPERGFSENKRLLQDRVQLKENTIVALRMVQNSIRFHCGDVS